MTQAYRRSLITALLLACVPLLVVSTILYFPVRQRVENAALAVHYESRKNTSDALAARLEEMETIALQWAMEKDVDVIRAAVEGGHAFQLQRELYQSLTTVSSLSPLIDEALVYLQDRPTALYSEDGVYHLGERETIQRCMSMLTSPERIQWTYDLLDKLTGVTQATPPAIFHRSVFLAVKLPALALDSTALLLFRLNDRELARMFAPRDGHLSLVLGPSGRVVSADRAAADKEDSALRALYQIVRPEDGTMYQAGSAVTLNGSSHGLFVFSLPVDGWRYFAAVSLDEIVSPVRTLSSIILLLVLAAVVVAGGISILASRSLYRPMKKLIGEFSDGEDAPVDDELDFIVEKWKRTIGQSSQLRAQLAESREELRSAFMLRYVQGYYHRLSDGELRSKLSHVGFAVGQSGLALTMIQLLSPGLSTFAEDEQEVLSLTAANIAREVIGDRVAHVYNFGSMTLGILTTFARSSQFHEVKAQQSQMAQGLLKALTARLSLRVIVSVGRPVRNAAELPEAFVALRQSLSYRAVSSTSQTIDVDDVLPKGDYSAPYPFDAEREILDAMQMGWRADAKTGVKRFFDEVTATGDRAFLVMESARQLLGNTLNAVLKAGFSPLTIFEGRDLYEELRELREMSQIEHWFVSRVVGPYIDAIKQVQDLQSRRLVQRVIELIHHEYASPLFSLEWTADTLSSYPQKISSAFKQITGTNFVAYLTKHRLMRAEDLLKTTDQAVSEIAEQVGYQPSYFNRIFKKHYGLTPGEFREEHTNRSTSSAHRSTRRVRQQGSA